MIPAALPPVNSTPPAILYRIPNDADLSWATAEELSDYADWLDAEAAATEMSARADEVEDELLDHPESFVLWPRSAPDYLPAA